MILKRPFGYFKVKFQPSVGGSGIVVTFVLHVLLINSIGRTELKYSKEKGAWSVIKELKPDPPTKKWTVNDERTLATTVLSVEDDQIRNCRKAKEAWEALTEFHEWDTPSNRVTVYNAANDWKKEVTLKHTLIR